MFPNPPASSNTTTHRKHVGVSAEGRMAIKYAYIIERTGDGGWGAWVPDLPGYACTGTSIQEVRQLVAEGVPFHIEGLRLEGLPVPTPGERILEFIDVS